VRDFDWSEAVVAEKMATGKETVATAAGPSAQTAQLAKAARMAGEVATFLARAYKNLHFYGANNPVPRESVERMFAALTSFLETDETLTYTLTETDLCYHGRPVYTNPDRRESLVFKLYRDGVRALSFHRGIALDDILWLLEALSRSKVDCEDPDSDVVTQIWERELAHITYIAVDDYFELETTDGETGQHVRLPGPDAAGAGSAAEGGAEEGSYGLAATPDFTLAEYSRAVSLDLALSEEELGEVGHQILAEERDDPKVKVSQIFLDVVRGQAPPELRADCTRVLQVLCAGLLEAGKPAEAAVLLGEIKRILENSELPRDVRVALDSFIEARGDEKELGLMETRIEDSSLPLLAGYAQYLSALNPNAVGPLCNMLGRLKTKKSREMLCRVLSAVAKQNLAALVGFLSDPRWYLVRNVVYVLRLMRETQATSSLEPLVTHEDPRVRAELTHCLAEIGGERAEAMLATLLNDAEKSLRLLAAKKLGQAGGARAANLLGEHIRRDAFLRRDPDEKSEMFDALGRTGSDDALPVLEKLIRKRSLLNWRDTSEMRKCAILAVGRLGTDKARDVLEVTARHARGSLRKAALEALRLCSLTASQGGSHE